MQHESSEFSSSVPIASLIEFANEVSQEVVRDRAALEEEYANLAKHPLGVVALVHIAQQIANLEGKRKVLGDFQAFVMTQNVDVSMLLYSGTEPDSPEDQ